MYTAGEQKQKGGENEPRPVAVVVNSRPAVSPPARPAVVGVTHAGHLYVEGDSYSRRKAFMGMKCQLWKSSGGRMGSTVITANDESRRTFIRKYGKVHSNSDSAMHLRCPPPPPPPPSRG